MSLLIAGFTIFVSIDLLRQKNPKLNQWALDVFRPIMRENEVHKLAGTTYLLTGVLILVLFFPRPIVGLSLLFLAFADPMASYVGIKLGKDKIFGHKSLQGFLAAFVVCLFSSWIYLWSIGVESRLIVIGLLAGLIGAFAELIPIGKLDDNLTLPILSAVSLKVLFYVFAIDFL
ncbi:MAG: diacylglycerol/polyprenol kinase family protein [Pseudobdellovibrionaceae bacterium]